MGGSQEQYYTFTVWVLTFREPSVNKKDLQALTIVGLKQNNPVLDPLVVLHLDNPLHITAIFNSAHLF